MSDTSVDDSLPRGVPAEDSPVPAGPATLPFGARPAQEPDRLELRAFPHANIVFRGVLVTTVVVVAIYTAAQLLAGGPPLQLALIVAPLTLLWLSIWTVVWYRQAVLPRVTFDREVGLLVLGWKGRRGHRPLASVIGVQVMQTRKNFGSPEMNIPAVTMYQVNLILDDPAERRLNVVTCDPWTARSTARLIADFLKVPVLDTAGATDDAAALSMLAEYVPIPSPVVAEEEPDVLLIRPHRFAFLLGVRWIGLVWIVVPLAVLTALGIVDWGQMALIGALICSGLLILLGVVQTRNRWACFDRAQGSLTMGRPRGRAPRPLASVKAVEVVDEVGPQMVLLPDDPQQPRLTLVADADMALVRRIADRVASFLGVPLLGVKRPAFDAADPLGELSRSALPSGKASVPGSACVVAQGEDVLLLRPRSRHLWLRIASPLVTLGLGLYVIWLAWFGQPAQGVSAWWALIILMGSVSQLSVLKPVLLHRVRFDRPSGLLTLGWYGFRETHPLAQIRAVQLVPGGLVTEKGKERVSYQMNLVLADANRDRLNLTDDSDLAWTRQAGQQVADFLGVPLIDQVADGD